MLSFFKTVGLAFIFLPKNKSRNILRYRLLLSCKQQQNQQYIVEIMEKLINLRFSSSILLLLSVVFAEVRAQPLPNMYIVAQSLSFFKCSVKQKGYSKNFLLRDSQESEYANMLTKCYCSELHNKKTFFRLPLLRPSEIQTLLRLYLKHYSFGLKSNCCFLRMILTSIVVTIFSNRADYMWF